MAMLIFLWYAFHFELDSTFLVLAEGLDTIYLVFKCLLPYPQYI